MKLKTKFQNALRSRPSFLWTDIRSIGNSTPAKLTILIPLVGYLIIFNEHVLHYLALSRELFSFKDGPAPTAPANEVQISLRLLSIYFGLCSIAAASLVYAIFCPKEIKRHGSAEEYAGGDGKNLSIGQLVALSRELDGETTREKAFVNLALTLNKELSTGHSAGTFRQKSEEIEVEGIRLCFEKKNRTWPSARLTCAALYATGLSILAIPSLDVFLRALSLLLHRLFVF